MRTTASVFHNASQVRSRPEPVVYGLRLSRLTLGHVFLLFRLESPVFGFAERNADHLDILLAVFVCAQPWRKSEKALNKWWLDWFMRFWAWRTSKLNQDLERARFAAWFESERKPIPARQPMVGSGSGFRTLSAPMPYRLLALMMHLFHMTEAQAMDLPLTHAECLFAAIAEWNGNLELVPEQIDDLLEFAAAEDAKRFHPDGTIKQEAPPI